MNQTIPSSTSATPALNEPSPGPRLAVVGCGPRGAYCLESLLRQFRRRTPDSRWRISVYEPSPCIGAGTVYDPNQPPYLIMNFAVRHIDFWKSGGEGSRYPGPTLFAWLQDHHPHWANLDEYIPRAIVGEYLHECCLRVIDDLDAFADVEIVRQKVSDLRHDGKAWNIDAGSFSPSFDEVVLTTGHEGLRCSDRLGPLPGGSVYPISTQLSERSKPPGSEAHLRGFGLTAIDAVLALTEGRGGAFAGNWRFPTYISSGREPSTIWLSSRSGRPMLAKPTEMLENIDQNFWNPFSERILATRRSGRRIEFRKDIWPVLLEATVDFLGHSDVHVSAAHVDDWMRSWSRFKMDQAAALDAMLDSLRVATKAEPRDIPSALGASWRCLYPAVVEACGYGRLAPDQWPAFQKTAAEMERIAFGPPAKCVAKLLSLFRTGRLRFAGDLSTRGPQVVSVLAGPHEHVPNRPLSNLLRRGWIDVDPASGGVRVDRGGRPCCSATPAGLAVVGRATEGWVIGNDTLSRTLHPTIEGWAQRVAGIAREQPVG